MMVLPLVIKTHLFILRYSMIYFALLLVLLIEWLTSSSQTLRLHNTSRISNSHSTCSLYLTMITHSVSVNCIVCSSTHSARRLFSIILTSFLTYKMTITLNLLKLLAEKKFMPRSLQQSMNVSHKFLWVMQSVLCQIELMI